MLNFFNFFSFLFLNGNNNANIIEPNVYETYFIIELGFIITYKKECQFSSICPNIWIPNMENLQDQLSTFVSMGDQHSVYVSNDHTTKIKKTIRTISQHEQGQSYYICEEDRGGTIH